MVATMAQEEPLGLDEVMSIIDETSHVIAYSHESPPKWSTTIAKIQKPRSRSTRRSRRLATSFEL